MALLESLELPGNFRELRNRLERAVLPADDRTIPPRHLVLVTDREGTQAPRRILTLAEAERDYLLRVLKDRQGDRMTLASMLGLSERALYRRLAAYKISADELDG